MGNSIQDSLSSSSITTADIWEIPSLAGKCPMMPFAMRRESEGAASSSTSSPREKGLSNPPVSVFS